MSRRDARGEAMEAFEAVLKLWPLAIGFITLVIVLAKLDQRVLVIEEKVKALFDLWNKKG
jgi:hypothetical protein